MGVDNEYPQQSCPAFPGQEIWIAYRLFRASMIRLISINALIFGQSAGKSAVDLLSPAGVRTV
jgi:hypothetical protein